MKYSKRDLICDIIITVIHALLWKKLSVYYDQLVIINLQRRTDGYQIFRWICF